MARKVFTLRKWLSLQEAAEHLSDLFSDSVTERDVLNLALDGELPLSVNFISQYETGVICEAVSEDHWLWGLQEFTQTKKEVKLHGIYGLPMIAGNKGLVQHIALGSLGYLDIPFDNEIFLAAESGDVIELQRTIFHDDGDGNRYTERQSAIELPDGAILCIRPSALTALASRAVTDSADTTSAWPWGTHDTKLLRDMAAAADALWKNYDPAQPDTAPTNDQVETFLMKRGVGKTMAEKMATILRADGLPPGPRK